jgi:hypothetical protein
MPRTVTEKKRAFYTLKSLSMKMTMTFQSRIITNSHGLARHFGVTVDLIWKNQLASMMKETFHVFTLEQVDPVLCSLRSHLHKSNNLQQNVGI